MTTGAIASVNGRDGEEAARARTLVLGLEVV